MGFIKDSDVGNVLADQEFMEQVVAGLVEDSSAMDSLCGDIAGNVQDALENDRGPDRFDDFTRLTGWNSFS